jgi:uncharacterized protein (TIGR02145 family)
MKKTPFFLLLFFFATYGQQEQSFLDSRDGKKYRVVKIGNQTWMGENLNYYASGSKCYDNKPENCTKYGRLYDWKTAKTACPSGWHLPSQAAWDVLGNDAKKLKATSGWYKNGNGTDDYGFSALPGGEGNSSGSFYQLVGYNGFWWSSSEIKGFEYDEAPPGIVNGNIYYRNMDYGIDYVLQSNTRSDLFSVRCLKDN